MAVSKWLRTRKVDNNKLQRVNPMILSAPLADYYKHNWIWLPKIDHQTLMSLISETLLPHCDFIMIKQNRLLCAMLINQCMLRGDATNM